MIKKNKIIVTGGTGRFAQSLKKVKSKYSFIYPSKKALDITKTNSIHKFLKKIKPKAVLHLAGLSRPMSMHEKNISHSINLNIIGTANLVAVCSKLNIKIIYFSTSYVYPGDKGNYKESDPLLPWNNYAWSKLGGECSVQMYKNSLVLRICMTEKPFIHKKAFANVKLNFIFHEDIVKILLKLLNKKGIINVGGKTRTIYNFAKQYNTKVRKILVTKNSRFNFPLNPSMNLSKLKKIIK
tara:strand:+ start:442 stop:1158 length:717 start_codon:yes stop_codon:yes gene_type:complete